MVSGVAFAPAPASASTEAEAEFRSALQSDEHLSKLFSTATPISVTVNRAEAHFDSDDIRFAISVYRQEHADGMNSVGRTFCHAALMRPEIEANSAWVHSKISDDLVADEIIRRTENEGGLKGVQDRILLLGEGWSAAICQAVLKDITAPQKPTLDQNTIGIAAYEIAKRLYKAGNEADALERFRKLRASDRYNDASLFVVAILLKRDHALAMKLNSSVVSFDKVKDIDALAVYADAMASVGEGDVEFLARQKMKELVR